MDRSWRDSVHRVRWISYINEKYMRRRISLSDVSLLDEQSETRRGGVSWFWIYVESERFDKSSTKSRLIIFYFIFRSFFFRSLILDLVKSESKLDFCTTSLRIKLHYSYDLSIIILRRYIICIYEIFTTLVIISLRTTDISPETKKNNNKKERYIAYGALIILQLFFRPCTIFQAYFATHNERDGRTGETVPRKKYHESWIHARETFERWISSKRLVA